MTMRSRCRHARLKRQNRLTDAGRPVAYSPEISPPGTDNIDRRMTNAAAAGAAAASRTAVLLDCRDPETTRPGRAGP